MTQDICDICKEQLDKDNIFKDLSGLQELFGVTCTTCNALAEIGGLMYLDFECQETQGN